MSKSSTPAENAAALLERRGSRREFLRKTAVTAIAGGVFAACKTKVPDGQAALPGADSNVSGGTMPPPAQTALAAQQAAADRMDAMHEAGIKAFPAKTEGKGNQILAPVMDGKTKVFNLTARPIKWEERSRYDCECVGVQRSGARSANSGEGGRSRARGAQERPPRIDFDSLSRTRWCRTIRMAFRSSHKSQSSPAPPSPTNSRSGIRGRTCITHTTIRRSRWGWGCWAPSSSSRRILAQSSAPISIMS